MSPASQTSGLHVERYLGSYLISNASRAGVHKLHPEYDVPGGAGKAAPKPPQYVGGGGVFRGGYCPGDGLFCPPPFCPTRSNWAGVPLISTASHRRGKPPPPAARPAPNAPAFHHQRMQMVNGPPCNIDFADGQHIPLSKLALHTRGAPLILSRRYNNNGNRKQNHYNNNNNNTTVKQQIQATNRPPVVPEIVIKKPRDIPKENRFDYKEQSSVVRTPSQNGQLALNIDSLSVTSDESSGSAHSETCLPRIIKPRKRRKKDRKPLSGTTQDNKTNTNEVKSEVSEPAADSSVVSLNSYISVYHENTDINHNNSNFKPLVANSDLLEYVKLYGTNNAIKDSGDNWKYLPSNNIPDTSLTNRNIPGLNNANDLDGDESDDSSSLFEAISRCSPTICQCRYCDPSRQIWDINQACYSPVLTVPIEIDLTDGKNPFEEKDTILRRSWSEPCPGYSVENLKITDYNKLTTSHRSDPNISSTCEQHEHEIKPCNNKVIGVIGAGRKTAETSESPSKLNWKEQPVTMSKHIPDTLFKSSSSHGVSLEVSSAIVTSLNGHRDLEIKFFSSSPSAVMSDAASFVYPNYKRNCDDKTFESVVSDKSKCLTTEMPLPPVTVQ